MTSHGAILPLAMTESTAEMASRIQQALPHLAQGSLRFFGDWFGARGVRRYMSADSLAKAPLEVIDGEAIEEVRGELVAAS
jgi:hypothetical protein